MSEQSSNAAGAADPQGAPAPYLPGVDLNPPAAPPLPDERMVSVQSQIGLAATAVLAILAFIFHKDLSGLAEPISVVAFSIYGAAIALARAFKHRTVVQAQLAQQDMRLGAWQHRTALVKGVSYAEVQRALENVHDHVNHVNDKVNLVREAVALKESGATVSSSSKKTPAKRAQRPAESRPAARKTSSRKTATGR